MTHTCPTCGSPALTLKGGGILNNGRVKAALHCLVCQKQHQVCGDGDREREIVREIWAKSRRYTTMGMRGNG